MEHVIPKLTKISMIYNLNAIVIMVNTRIYIICNKVIFGQKEIKLQVPLLNSLTKPINVFVKMTNKLLFLKFVITFKLPHENFFKQITIQKCHFDVILNDIHVMGNIQFKYCSNGLMLNNRKIGFIIINAITLGLALSYQACLVMKNGTIIMNLEFNKPILISQPFAQQVGGKDPK